MKIKTKFSALTVAIAMGMVGLVGCNKSAGPSDPGGPVYYTVSFVKPADCTVTGIVETGYEVNSLVTFSLTVGEGRELVSVAGDKGVGQLTPTAGQYSFRMPEDNVRITVTDRAIKTYALSLPSGKSLQVDGEAITMELNYGTDAVTDFTVAATEGAEHVSVNGKVVTPVSAGAVTLAATLTGGTAPVATLQTTVLASLKMSIGDAITDAWGDGTTAFANNDADGPNAMSTGEYIITAKVVVIGKPYNGAVEAVIDDGTGLLDLQCLSVSESNPCPFVLGDVIQLKNKLQNHHGLFEISGYPDTISVVTDTPVTPHEIPDMDADGYVTALDGLTSENGKRFIVPARVHALGNPGHTEGKQRWNIKGVTSTKYNNGLIACTKSSITMLCEQDVEYVLEGYILNWNSSNSAKYSNFFATSCERLAATEVHITETSPLSLPLNQSQQLHYTTVPAGAGRSVTWSSDHPENVEVSETGLATAKAAGTSAVITLTVDGQTDTITINVPGELTPATSASFSAAETSVNLGSTLDLNTLLTVLPEGQTDKKVWSVEEGKAAVLTVDADTGVVTPVGEGFANVTVTLNASVSATIKVNVVSVHGQSVDNPLTVEEAIAKATALNAAYQADKYTEEEWYVGAYVEEISTAYSETYKNFSFKCKGFLFDKVSVDDADVSKVVLGAAVVVKGYLHNYSQSYKINMQKNGDSAPAIQTIDVSKPTFIVVAGANEVKVGQNVTLTATVYPTALALAVDNWEASNDNATVANGVVTGASAGPVTISASYGNGDDKITGSHDMTVSFDRQYQLDKQALFGTGKTQDGVTGTGSYTATLEHTNNGFTVVTKNINSGGTNYWDTLRFGRKSDASVAEIYTKTAVTSAVAKVTVNLTQAGAADKVTAKVQTSTNGTDWTDAGSFSYAVGEQGVELATPTANLYYKIVFTCQATGSNGSGRFNQFNLYVLQA